MKGEHFENLKKGMWVFVTNVREVESSWGQVIPARPYPVNGAPLRIMAISWPFVCVTSDGHNRFSIDFRDCTLRKCPRDFVLAATRSKALSDIDLGDDSREEHPIIIEDQPRRRRKKKKSDQRLLSECPACGTRLRESRAAGGPWMWRCPECGFTGTRGESAS